MMLSLLFNACLLVGCLGSSKFNFVNTYGDYMVLQHANGNEKTRATISGVSLYASDEVTVKLSTMQDQNTILQTKMVNAENEKWQILLDPVDASNKEYYITATSSSNVSDVISLSHILFGDVYICSGQSNMGFTVYEAFNESTSLAQANNYPNIRVFKAAPEQSNTEQTQLIRVAEPWTIAKNTTVANFSAVCWFYGMYLYDTLQHPMGLIMTCWGGTPIRDWMSPDAIALCPNETDAIMKLGGPANDSILWNSMIYPFLTTSIKGAIWYQGENDSGQEKYAESYKCAFKAMIDDWRNKWNMNSNTSSMFPFGFVQISVWNDEKNATCGPKWSQCLGAPEVRWAQTGNVGYLPNKELQNVFMAVVLDLGDPSSPYGDIHPRYKQQMAKRLANASLNMVYGYNDIYWLGPYGDNITCTIDNNTKKSTISINFGNVNSDGLLMKNSAGFEWYNSTSKLWNYIKDDVFSITNNGMSIQFMLNGSDVTEVRYNFYLTPCMPVEGIYNCAVYDKKGLLPAGGFILPVSC